MDELEVAVQYGGIVFSAVGTALATWHFKGKEAMRKQTSANTREILKLKGQQDSHEKLFSQKFDSLHAEIRDIRDTLKEDVNEIKDSVKTLTLVMTTLAESQGELRGQMASFKTH